MKISNRISLSIFILVLILACTCATFLYIIAKRDLREGIYNHLTTAAVSRRNHIKTFLESKEESVENLAQSVVFRTLLSASDKDADYAFKFNQALTQVKATQHELARYIYEISLLDRRGKCIISKDESKVGVDWSNDACFLGGSKATYIEDAYYSEAIGGNFVCVTSPIKDNQSGELLGVVVCRVNLNALNEITTERTGLGKTGEIYVVNKYGYMITPSRFIKDTFLKQKVDTDNARRALLHKTEEHVLHLNSLASVFSNYRGVQVLGTHEYIPKMHWGVLAEIETKEVFAPLVRLQLGFLGIIAVILFIAWIMGIVIARRIVSPLHRLHKGTEIIGAGNLDYKVGTSAQDEVGQLSRAFDAMTTALQKTTVSRDELLKEMKERKLAEESLKLAYDQIKATQIQLIQAEKMSAVGVMASGVAHEVKNPLGIMLQGINFFEGELPLEQKDNHQMLAMMKNSVKRADNIVRALLDFARADELTVEPQEINTIIESSINLVQHRLRLNSIELVRELGKGLPKALMDIGKMEQVFVNLFNNAIEAMPKGGKLYVRSYLSELKAPADKIGNRKEDIFGQVFFLL